MVYYLLFTVSFVLFVFYCVLRFYFRFAYFVCEDLEIRIMEAFWSWSLALGILIYFSTYFLEIKILKKRLCYFL